MSLIGKEITEFEAQAFHENEFKTIKKEDIENIIITESMIDSLSLLELKKLYLFKLV